MAALTITAARVATNKSIEALTLPAGEAVTAGQLLKVNPTTGKFEKANASSAAELGYMNWIASRSAAAGVTVTGVRQGEMDLGSALGDLSYGAKVYANDTDGSLGTAAGTVEKIVGVVTARFVNPSGTADKVLTLAL